MTRAKKTGTNAGAAGKTGNGTRRPIPGDAPKVDADSTACASSPPKGGAARTRTTNQTSRRGPNPEVLTERERRFIDALLGPANGSPGEAARIAGYAGPASGSALMKRARVRQEVSRRTAQNRRSAETVMDRLWCIVQADMADYAGLIGCKSQAQVRKELARLKAEGKSLAIRRLVPSRWGLGVELYPANEGLELAGKHLGLFTDRLEVTVKPPAVDSQAQHALLSDPEACELACSLDARLALPSPAPQKAPGVAQDEPVDVEWSNLSSEPDDATEGT